MSNGMLVADVVATWLAKGENRPTLCFGVDRVHAKLLQARFLAAGVPCEYIDAHTDAVEREAIKSRFISGEIKVVCNVGCLTTGVDWPVGCIILARPTKSKMLYVQMIGRGLRMNPGIEDCIILDHADNTLRMGFVTEIEHSSLSTHERKEAVTERTAPLPKECPKCAFLKPVKVRECPNCGFVPEAVSQIATIDGELVQVRGKSKEPTRAEKQAFLSGLYWIARERGRQSSWVRNTFKDRFGTWPNGFTSNAAEPSQETLNYVKSRDISFSYARGKRNAA